MKVKLFVRSGTLYVDYTHNGKRFKKSSGLKDSEENRKILEDEVVPALIKKLKLSPFVHPAHKTFSYFFSKFMLDRENDKSFNHRKYVYDKVHTYFKEFEVLQINRRMIKEYLDTLDIKNSSKKDYLGCVKGVLDIAIDEDVIERNVAIGISFKREEKVESNPFSEEEIELILAKSDGMFRNYIAISLYTGMRSGEVLGLMHSDILEDRIRVRRSVSKGRVTTPKTLRSIRDIPVLESVKPFIDSQRKLSKSLYLFEYDGVFIKDASFFKRRWHELVKNCGIKYRKLYSTRHTFITAMLNSGKFKIMEIAAIVGHTSPEMIMKNYAGFIMDEHLKIDTSIDLFKKEEYVPCPTLSHCCPTEEKVIG